ncbi:MAG: hypothetical protein AAFY72_12645 [Cyanobacteria bacterium J06649_4]
MTIASISLDHHGTPLQRAVAFGNGVSDSGNCFEEFRTDPSSANKNIKLRKRMAQSQTGVMQFAGMLADTPGLADGIIEDAQLSRQMDLRRNRDV